MSSAPDGPRLKYKADYITVTICMPRSLLNEVDRCAWMHELSRSSLIRKACEQLVTREQPSRLAEILHALQVAASVHESENPNHSEGTRLRLYRQASALCADLLKDADLLKHRGSEPQKEELLCEP